MPETVRDVMSPKPVAVEPSTSIIDAARAMRDNGVGDVLVVRDGRLEGLVTDRDIVVRGVAEGGDLGSTSVGELCSDELITVAPTDDVERAVQLMRDRAVRRLPVVEGNEPVGIVSIGDIAIERQPGTALADISSQPPND
jgi:CBS domain-containing protein